MFQAAIMTGTVQLLLLLQVALGMSEVKITKDFVPETCEQKSKSGDYLTMHYTGTIDTSSATGEGGNEFDSSYNRGDPFNFQLGGGQVIQGWDEGLLDMCIGEKRTLVIPPEKGYGSEGAGGAIPGGATLNFDVELLAISDEPAPEPNIFLQIDTDGDKKLSKEEIKKFFADSGQEQSIDDIDNLMAQEDKDSDGFISFEEFSGPKGEEEEL